MQDRKSESVVTINAKFSSFNFEKLRFRDAVNVIEEGRFVCHDATTGYARKAIETDPVVFVNFLVSSAPSVQDFQADAFDANSPVQPLEAGGLSGIEGAGIELGIPSERWYDIVTFPPAVGKYVLCFNAGGAVADQGKPRALAAGALAPGDITFGVITKIRGSQIFFIFSSLGHLVS